MHKQLAGVLRARHAEERLMAACTAWLVDKLHPPESLSTASLPRFKGAWRDGFWNFIRWRTRVDELIPDRRYEFIHRAELRLTKMDLEEEVCANPSRSARNIYRQGKFRSPSLGLCSPVKRSGSITFDRFHFYSTRSMRCWISWEFFKCYKAPRVSRPSTENSVSRVW